MAPDIFALPVSDGDHAQADRMFIGKVGDTVAAADTPNAVHHKDRRLYAVSALASRFRNGATYPIPCVRLTKAGRHIPADVITDSDQSMPGTTKARKLVDLSASSVCVYRSELFMDDKTTDRVMPTSLNYFSHNIFSTLLVLTVSWDLGWLLGFALVRSIQPKTGAAFYRRLCPIVSILVAFSLAYKLMFSA